MKLVYKNGVFEIRKLIFNSVDELCNLGEEKPVIAVHFNQDNETLKEFVLGIVWNRLADGFSFSRKQREGRRIFTRW